MDGSRRTVGRYEVVHLGIKPENLPVTLDGGVKIADFGIAKATSALETSPLLTAIGTTRRHPTNIAPEQAMARPCGPWTDLYSVGVTAFELFVGPTHFGHRGAWHGMRISAHPRCTRGAGGRGRSRPV